MLRKLLAPKFDQDRGALIVRGYAKKEDSGQWVAICLEFNLAAQACSYKEVRKKLHAQIEEYVSDAFGEESEHRSALLNRPAPVGFWAEYFGIYVRHEISKLKDGIANTFSENVKMVPKHA